MKKAELKETEQWQSFARSADRLNRLMESATEEIPGFIVAMELGTLIRRARKVKAALPGTRWNDSLEWMMMHKLMWLACLCSKPVRNGARSARQLIDRKR